MARSSALDALAPLGALAEQLLEALPIDLAVFDPEGRFLYLNAFAVADPEMRRWLTGRTERDYCRRQGLDPAISERREASRRQAREERRSVHFEEVVPGKTGEPRHYIRSVMPVFGPDGDLRRYISYGLDITERVRAEAELRGRLELEAKYQRLFEQSKDVVYVSTPDGRLLDMNPAGVELFGYSSKEDMMSLDLGRDFYVEPWQRRRLNAALDRDGFVQDFELFLKTRDGRRLTVQATTSAVRNEAGRVVAYLGILRDVTAQRQLEEQLSQSQKMEALGRLAGGMAHGFNNLLTAINGYSDLILRQIGETSELRPFAEEIRRAGRRGAELTAKMITLSRRRVVSPQLVDVNRLALAVEDSVGRLIGEDIELETRLDPNSGRVRADPGQLEQALLNLVVNARDAMPSGGRLLLETRRVRLPRRAPSEGADGVCLAVHDSGAGIPPEIQQHIFEPFFSTKDAGQGSGLGLSTVYATIAQNGGTIDVESSPDTGTVFRILLPRAGPAPEAGPQPPPAAADGTGRVLLVEDDPIVRRLVRTLLECRGYRVLVAADGQEAMALFDAEREPMDLLVSDVVMPGMSGPELAATLRSRQPQLRILFISGYTNSFTAQHGFAASAHPLLQKPFDADELARKVSEVMSAPVAS